MSLEIVDLGASEIDKDSGVIIASAKGAPIDDEEAPSYNSSPMMPCLGVACRPAPADENGAAQGIAAQVSGLDGVIIAGHDPRAAKIYGELKDGETALFATGAGYDARVLCKDQMVAIIVGDDYVFQIDRKKKQIVLNCPGGDIRISEKSGVSVTDGKGAMLQLADGAFIASGQFIAGGRKPVGTFAQAEKVDANLAAIAAAIAALCAAVDPPIAPPPYIFTPASSTKAPGAFVGG